MNKTAIRRLISSCEKKLKNESNTQIKIDLLKSIAGMRATLKTAMFETDLPGTDGAIYIEEKENVLPDFGKFKMILEKNYQDELEEFSSRANNTPDDYKRLALRRSFLDYYNDLEYPIDAVIVEYEGDMTLRRDDQEKDKTDLDFAPNKNIIYQKWIEQLGRYVREKKLDKYEYDESVERGIPQGGAFEKMLDRYRQDIMRDLWEDYFRNRVSDKEKINGSDQG